MKRTLLMVMAVALLLTQCRKPAVELPTAGPANENMVSMTVTVGHGGKTDINGTTGTIKWSAGDKLYVGDGSNYIGCLELQSGAGEATGTFTGSVTADAGTYTFGFYYLGSGDYTSSLESDPTSVDIPFGTQTGLRENLSDCHIGYGTASGRVDGTSVILENPTPVTMTSKVAIAYFEFKENGTSDYTGAITLSGTNIYNKMTVKFSGAEDGKFTGKEGTAGKAISLASTPSSKKYVMLVPTGTGEETLEFGGGAEGTTTLYKGIEANKFYCVGAGDPIAVTVTPWEPTWVDLGLPSGLLWATCNLGASKPEEHGDYYAWGEILPYHADGHSQDDPCNTWRSMTTGAGNTDITNGYAWETYSKGGSSSFTEWTTPPYDATTNILKSDYDAATANWGSDWRMPTAEEWQSLFNNTTVALTDNYNGTGVAGLVLTSTDGKGTELFLPRNGCRFGAVRDFGSADISCWSSSCFTGSPDGALCWQFGGPFPMPPHAAPVGRYGGMSVRPVRGGATPEPPATPKFSVGENTTVEFAPGNLYYNGASDASKMNSALPSGWNFYEHQWDCYPSGTSSVTELMEISLFTWGYGEWSTNYSATNYQTGKGEMIDWGIAPGLPDAGEDKSWRTLTYREWDYLLNTSNASSGARTDANRFAKAVVNGVKGLLIFPDGYTGTVSDDGIATVNSTGVSYPSGSIPTEKWKSMESAGVVFLPANGKRNWTKLTDVGSYGSYWSSDWCNSSDAFAMNFKDDNLWANQANSRATAVSVRLVR